MRRNLSGNVRSPGIGDAGGLRVVNVALLVLAGGLVVAGACSFLGGAPSVEDSTLWVDTVQRGDFVQERRGPGRLVLDESGELTAWLRIPENHSFGLEIGQTAVVDVRVAEVDARVAGLADRIEQGTLRVDLELTGELPEDARPGLSVDGRIEVRTVPDVLHVGKPAYARENRELALFKVVGDRQAVRVPVQVGIASVDRIVVESGLEEGDEVILSDMSRYATVERVHLR